ncbi:MAG: hypothetical protein Q9213_003995 [Squamulea squamosa]
MPSGRVYIVNSPDLAIAVQKHPKKLSFWFIEATFATRVAGLSKGATEAIQDNIHGENGQPSLFMDGMLAMHKDLKPSENLDRMIHTAVQKLAASMDMLSLDQGEPTELWGWVNMNFMTSTTHSIWGPRNPFQDPMVAQAYLAFEDNMIGLMSFPLPSVTCATAYAGREKVVAAFEKYFVNHGPDNASHLLQSRSKASDGFNLSINDKARLEVTLGHALLSNTTPTAFWTLYHIFSDSKVLNEVREEVSKLLILETHGDTTTRTIDIGRIREVALLNSVLHESLRHYGSGTNSRIVLEDIMLDGKYLLKKDAFVFLPNHAYHFDRLSWGDTVNDFDSYRFIDAKAQPSGAFRGFGGGANLCPGRFFAASEILSMCAMFAMRYDLKPALGTWHHPGTDNSNMSVQVHPPKREVSVNITVRKGWEGGKWAFRI